MGFSRKEKMVVTPSQAIPRTPKEIIRSGPLETRFLLDGDDTAGQLYMFEFPVQPGARTPPPHYHEHIDEEE